MGYYSSKERALKHVFEVSPFGGDLYGAPSTKKIPTFAPAKRSIAAVLYSGGKSGQHRASCFLTGRRRQPATASATENKPPRFIGVRVKP